MNEKRRGNNAAPAVARHMTSSEALTTALGTLPRTCGMTPTSIYSMLVLNNPSFHYCSHH